MDAEARKFLGNLWADSAPLNRQTPEAVGIERTRGWTLEYEQHGTNKYPERKVWNQLVRELQGAFAESMLYGFPRWAADVDWPQYAFVLHDSKIWHATTANGPNETTAAQEPGTGNIWRQF